MKDFIDSFTFLGVIGFICLIISIACCESGKEYPGDKSFIFFIIAIILIYIGELIND